MARTELPTGADDATGMTEAIRFQRDLYLYWRAAQAAGGLPLTTRRYVARPALRRIRERLAAPASAARADAAARADLAEGEEARLLFIRRLLERLGLLRAAPEESRLLTAPESEMARWLAHPLARRLRIGARLWVAGGWWPDQPDPRGEPPRLMAPAPPRLAIARRHTLEFLAALAPGDLVPVPGGAALPAATARTPRRRPSPKRLPSIAPGEDETLRAALLGPLAWLGFVLPTAHAPLTTCQAGVALAALRDREETEELPALAERGGRLILLPNLEVVAYAPLSAPTLAALDSWAEAVALDTVARYRLTRAAFARAGHAGWTSARVAAALEELAGAPLPANVRVTLADWERHVERVRLTPAACVLEAPTPALLDALLADRATVGWVERRLTPTAALLTTGSAARVRAWLLRHGELPAFSRHQATDGASAGEQAEDDR
ncbi:MAG: helicase-associated domain-containing protein [Ktedonobacterales bacterium]|nr:helicase-associated domain-containing protein [Ktedonobacterales bacterium]